LADYIVTDRATPIQLLDASPLSLRDNNGCTAKVHAPKAGKGDGNRTDDPHQNFRYDIGDTPYEKIQEIIFNKILVKKISRIKLRILVKNSVIFVII